MPRTRIFTPANTIAHILGGGPGATTTDDLVRHAEARLVDLAPQINEFVASEVQTILALGTQAEELVFADCRELADAAMRVAEVAGTANMYAIGEVARGIRAMIESLFIGGLWHSDALRLHIESLAMLVQPQERTEAEEKVILDRLKNMRLRIGVLD